MKFKCPVCSSPLTYKYECDWITQEAEISIDGSVNFITDEDESDTTVECRKDGAHKIPEELQDKVIELVRKSYEQEK